MFMSRDVVVMVTFIEEVVVQEVQDPISVRIDLTSNDRMPNMKHTTMPLIWYQKTRSSNSGRHCGAIYPIAFALLDRNRM